MNNKIEPGMLCLITGATLNVANIGKVVTAVRLVPADGLIPELGPFACNGTGGPAWLISGEDLTRNRARPDGNIQFITGSPLAFSRPQHLMPLHPPAEEPSQCARQSKLIPA